MTGNHRDPFELMTVAQLADLAKQGHSTIRQAIAEKRIRAVHLGRSVRIPRAEAERYLSGSVAE